MSYQAQRFASTLLVKKDLRPRNVTQSNHLPIVHRSTAIYQRRSFRTRKEGPIQMTIGSSCIGDFVILLLIAWWKTPRILNPMNCLEAGIRPMDALNESRYTRRGTLVIHSCKSEGEHGSVASVCNRQFVQTIFATVGSRHLGTTPCRETTCRLGGPVKSRCFTADGRHGQVG
jgi:hypothetical protein